jgi:hypothetical protein
MANRVSASIATLCTLDPDFQSHPAPAQPAGPGLTLLGQEREVVRRLAMRFCLRKTVPAEVILESLPKGVSLSDSLKIHSG